MDTNTKLDNAIRESQTIVADTGYPPVLIDERLDLHDLAWSHDDDDTLQLESFAASRMADDPATRSVIAGILWRVSRFDVPPGRNEDEVETQSERRAVLDRYLALVAPHSILDLKRLWWEMHAAAAIGNLDRVLALGRRAEDLSSDPADLAPIARVIFLMVNTGAVADLPPAFWIPSLSSDETTAEVQCSVIVIRAVVLDEADQDLEWRCCTARSKSLTSLCRSESHPAQ